MIESVKFKYNMFSSAFLRMFGCFSCNDYNQVCLKLISGKYKVRLIILMLGEKIRIMNLHLRSIAIKIFSYFIIRIITCVNKLQARALIMNGTREIRGTCYIHFQCVEISKIRIAFMQLLKCNNVSYIFRICNVGYIKINYSCNF